MNEEKAMQFSDLELHMFKAALEVVRQAMPTILHQLDEYIAATRDHDRYEVLEREWRELETMCGPVRYQRRCYRDKETGERVFLVDEYLGIDKSKRVSPGLAALAVALAAGGPSYRSAAEQLKRLYGGQVLSHEGIRQLTIAVGEKAVSAEAAVRSERRKSKVLFVEVDGVYTGRQTRRKKKIRKQESKVAVIHEGWRQRYNRSQEYELVNKHRMVEHGSASRLWERVRRWLESNYEDIDSVMVVINGDNAEWTCGTEHFGQAMYQYDRFHLKRDVKAALSDQPKLCVRALAAIDANEPARLATVLREGISTAGSEERIKTLHRYLALAVQSPDCLIDYRKRLDGLSYDVSAMRGLGAAESNVGVVKSRLRARSWSVPGLHGLTGAVLAMVEGKLDKFAHHVSTMVEAAADKVISAGVAKLAHGAMGDHPAGRRGHFPALDRGTQGYAKLFRALIHDSI